MALKGLNVLIAYCQQLVARTKRIPLFEKWSLWTDNAFVDSFFLH